jgi:hypothetical protein
MIRPRQVSANSSRRLCSLEDYTQRFLNDMSCSKSLVTTRNSTMPLTSDLLKDLPVLPAVVRTNARQEVSEPDSIDIYAHSCSMRVISVAFHLWYN